MTPTSDHAVEGRDSGRLVVLLGALTTFGPLSIDTYLPALPALRRDFGAGASQAQLTLSACLIGLALGQLLAGPLSDALGRRRPLLVGLAAYALASLLCAAAPTIGVLMGLRFVQGCAGAAGIVISRAVVRDMHAGTAAARYFSRLMLVNGLAPILAPILGGQLLRFMTWHGVFVVLAILGSALFLAAWFGLPETMPPANRQTGGFAATFQAFRELLADRAFTGYALSAGFAFAVLFS
ncbi:MAG: Bcr/CflA family efflux MFS transporter, partial [Thermomicrobiales bacterium]